MNEFIKIIYCTNIYFICVGFRVFFLKEKTDVPLSSTASQTSTYSRSSTGTGIPVALTPVGMNFDRIGLAHFLTDWTPPDPLQWPSGGYAIA